MQVVRDKMSGKGREAGRERRGGGGGLVESLCAPKGEVKRVLGLRVQGWAS